MSMHFRFLDHPNCLNDDGSPPVVEWGRATNCVLPSRTIKTGSLWIRLVSESTLTLAGYNGNPEPVKEKTLKNSREFFAKHVGPALAQPMRKDGQEVKDLKSERG